MTGALGDTARLVPVTSRRLVSGAKSGLVVAGFEAGSLGTKAGFGLIGVSSTFTLGHSAVLPVTSPWLVSGAKAGSDATDLAATDLAVTDLAATDLGAGLRLTGFSAGSSGGMKAGLGLIGASSTF